MKFVKRLFGISFFAVFAALFISLPAIAAQISIPSLESTPGQTLKIPIIIDKAEKLAGVKIVMQYDAKILTFQKAAKSKQTASLMHVINDKKPGTLIIVMAGAKGIKGKNCSLVDMIFEVKKDVIKSVSTVFKISEIQLMGEDLKAIEAKIRVHPLKINVIEKNKISEKNPVPVKEVSKEKPDALQEKKLAPKQ